MEKHVYLSGKRGFTLIELMVVVAIIGILMAAGIVMFSDAQKVARDAKRRADVDAIAKALEQYYQNNNEYPWSPIASSQGAWGNNAGLGTFFTSGSMPVDPVNEAPLVYNIRSVNQDRPNSADPQTRFCVQARLEKPNGNCSGSTTSTVTNPESNRCQWVAPGTGTNYCVGNRQ